MYDLHLALKSYGRVPLQLVIADVSDWQKIDRVFDHYRPQIIFHGAASKHVPLVECHPDEAVRVNILGTAVVCEMAHEYRAERFVFISTDKAVKPSSVMGVSQHKRGASLYSTALGGLPRSSWGGMRSSRGTGGLLMRKEE